METYEIEVRHPGLHKYRVIRGRDEYVVQQKAEAQLCQWDEMWARRQAGEQRAVATALRAEEREANKQLAEERTQEAQDALAKLSQILAHTLSVNDAIAWEGLKDRSAFQKPRPGEPAPLVLPPEPDPKHLRYHPRIGFLDRLFSRRRKQKEHAANQQFRRDRTAWERACQDGRRRSEESRRQHEQSFAQWQVEAHAFVARQAAQNAAINDTRARYLRLEPETIEEYCDLVLSRSTYPDSFPQEFQLEYLPTSKTMVVEYSLPATEHLPRLKEVRFVQSRNEFVETQFTDKELGKLYDNVLYQIVLRTIHELFEADVVNALDSVVFNGWVRFVDASVGKEVNACILSLQVERVEFVAINLAQVDPKACFRKLKGVGSSQLHSLTPVPPILTLNRSDKRFVSSYGVAETLHEGVNLAAIDWEDFEHLVRELFEKEFARDGGEVRVTRASRDGGVDAVIFDPDPLRGGKIVVQAKRYTNTVGVSAVRDLYGTLMNEGAMKGILVATSDYGPDAYAFAKDKPITLLSGSNLLHLLQKHGHKAHIDLQQARRELAKRGE